MIRRVAGGAVRRAFALAVGTLVAAVPVGASAVQEAPPPGAVSIEDSVPFTETPTPGTEADARDAELDALTAEIAARLRCLVCRGQSVAESSSRLAREMQSEIRTRLGRGETPEQIVDFFVDSYGEWILLRPPPRGVNLLVYVLPAAAFLLGLAGIWWWLGARRGAPATAETSGRPDEPVDDGLDPDDRAWLEAAVRESS